mgnify:FL=1
MVDDDIAHRVLEGDTYEQAAVVVTRAFPISLERKIQLGIAGLLVSVLLAPLLSLQQDAIVALEGAEPAAFRLGTFVFLGILTVFVAGLLLIGLESRTRSLSTLDRARKLVRIEEFLMWYQLLGLAFVVIGTAIAAAGLVSTDLVRLLYEFDVQVYGSAGIVLIDVWAISGIGGLMAMALVGLRSLSGA